MYIKGNDFNHLVNRFPKIKLSYDKIIHKKVCADLYQAIPYGKKYFAWFTWFKNENVCIFMEYDKKNKTIINIFIKPVCFNNELSYGTILFGTMINNCRFFIIDDILYYKNDDVSKYTYQKKIYLYIDLFEQIKKTNLLETEVIISMPLINNNYDSLCDELSKLPYDTYAIAYVQLKMYSTRQVMRYENKDVSIVFQVKADIQNDIYHLYYKENNIVTYFDIAYIPSMECSKMMNNLFRIIKENTNIDYLEESDDEEDFQNTNINKYVNLDKFINMSCKYSHKFKKWIPIKESNENIITKELLKY